MASITTSLTERAARGRRGFTLVEVMIAAALGAMLLTAVMSSFIVIGRSGALLYNYAGLESQARRALEKFGEDTRMSNACSEATSGNITTLTLTIPHVASDVYNNTVAYAYDTSAQTLVRTETDTTSGNVAQPPTSQTVLTNISKLQFNAWKAGSQLNVASSFTTADELQVSLTLQTQANQYGTKTSAVAAATNFVVSARFIMRNKKLNE